MWYSRMRTSPFLAPVVGRDEGPSLALSSAYITGRRNAHLLQDDVI